MPTCLQVRGVGKTTIARILAKCLNCETGVTSTPCEVCATCRAVNEGRFIDLIEIDAASRTKVEDTRELLDNVPYAPTQGRFKVYLIDEVHMLSTHSFNALLKTLEEPPEHVKFYLQPQIRKASDYGDFSMPTIHLASFSCR
jgi:DNA polymerase-3 subunit gamma/tau